MSGGWHLDVIGMGEPFAPLLTTAWRLMAFHDSYYGIIYNAVSSGSDYTLTCYLYKVIPSDEPTGWSVFVFTDSRLEVDYTFPGAEQGPIVGLNDSQILWYEQVPDSVSKEQINSLRILSHDGATLSLSARQVEQLEIQPQYGGSSGHYHRIDDGRALRIYGDGIHIGLFSLSSATTYQTLTISGSTISVDSSSTYEGVGSNGGYYASSLQYADDVILGSTFHGLFGPQTYWAMSYPPGGTASLIVEESDSAYVDNPSPVAAIEGTWNMIWTEVGFGDTGPFAISFDGAHFDQTSAQTTYGNGRLFDYLPNTYPAYPVQDNYVSAYGISDPNAPIPFTDVIRYVVASQDGPNLTVVDDQEIIRYTDFPSALGIYGLQVSGAGEDQVCHANNLAVARLSAYNGIITKYYFCAYQHG